MGIGDKIDNAKDQLAGKAKGAAGDATDNEDLQAEGQVQESKGPQGRRRKGQGRLQVTC